MQTDTFLNQVYIHFILFNKNEDNNFEELISIIWLLNHLINSKKKFNNYQFFLNYFSTSKIFDEILQIFSYNHIDNNLLEKTILLIFYFLTNSKKIVLLEREKLRKIIIISSTFLYVKNKKIIKICLDILSILISLESKLVKEIILEEGILNRLLTIIEYFNEEENDQIDNKIENKYLVNKCLLFIGDIISIYKKKKIIEVSNK